VSSDLLLFGGPEWEVFSRMLVFGIRSVMDILDVCWFSCWPLCRWCLVQGLPFREERSAVFFCLGVMERDIPFVDSSLLLYTYVHNNQCFSSKMRL
jgi:hypothetical protein